MKKYLPLMLLLLIACDESTSIVSSGGPSPRVRAEVSTDFTVAAAADHVLPAAYATVMGEVNNIWPHSQRNMRYQQVFLGSEIDMDKIDGVCLRHDDAIGGRQSSDHLKIKLGPTQLDNTNLGLVFDDNYSSPPTEVFDGDVIIPATTGAGTVDMFDFCITFTTPYLHPAGSNLVIEWINTSSTAVNHAKDACAVGHVGCTTRRVLAFNAAATTATFADNSGLIMSFFTADPEVKADCTENRWVEYGFRNQGQCIRFVETEKDSR